MLSTCGLDMAADSSNPTAFRAPPPPFYDHRMLSFQSGAAASGMFSTGTITNSRGLVPAAAGGKAGAGVVHDPSQRMRRDMGQASDWSFQEQIILREGLAKYANEPSIMKYIKIAAMLRDKTVRDVALRGRWMTKKEHGKRRKPEQYAGKKFKDRKDKIVDSYSENIHMLNSDMASYSLMMMHHVNHIDQFSCQASALDGEIRNLMDENAQAFSQIEANLGTLKIHDNIDLFCLTRNNIAGILNSMSEMPGIMSHMPPLPVSVDEQLLNFILPGPNQALVFGAPSGVHLKQEQ